MIAYWCALAGSARIILSRHADYKQRAMRGGARGALNFGMIWLTEMSGAESAEDM
jgi:hypothetical protein